MRLWSLHPRHLDRQGLLAAWREGLLAQAVLLGKTQGYTNHPQLERFRHSENPEGTIGTYLSAIADEATSRGYRFDVTKITQTSSTAQLTVTADQLDFERQHLLRKIQQRNPHETERIARLTEPTIDAHPIFHIIPGAVASWERGNLA